jgi:hypothetical protein
MTPVSSLLSPHSFWLRLCRAMEIHQIESYLGQSPIVSGTTCAKRSGFLFEFAPSHFLIGLARYQLYYLSRSRISATLAAGRGGDQ